MDIILFLPFPHSLPSPLMFLPLFKFLTSSYIITVKYIFICMYICIHTHKLKLLSLFSVACMCRTDRLGLDTYQGAWLWRKWILPLSEVINCLQLFWWGLVTFPTSTLVCQLVLSLCRSCVGNCIVETSWMQLLYCIQKILSSSRYTEPLGLTIFPPILPMMLPEPQVQGLHCRCISQV